MGSDQRKNAFRYFMDDYQLNARTKGQPVSTSTAARECAVLWNDLEPSQKDRYCDKANPMRHCVSKDGVLQPAPSNMEYLDPVTGIYGERWTKYVKSKDELFYLKHTITDEHTLKTQSFFVVHCNYFCNPSRKHYVPAEISLVEFNLTRGIIKTYDSILNTEPIPIGQAYETKKRTEGVHGIPPPPAVRGERERAKVVYYLREMLRGSLGPKGQYPPLFTLEEDVLPTMHILNDFVRADEKSPKFIVYPIHRMFYWLKNKCSDVSGKGVGFLDEVYAVRELERDTYRYCLKIACSFHRRLEGKYPMCSSSIARRLVYMICDHCSRLLDVEIIKGRHVPINCQYPSYDVEADQRVIEFPEYKLQRPPIIVDVYIPDDDELSNYSDSTGSSGVDELSSTTSDDSDSSRRLTFYAREFNRKYNLMIDNLILGRYDNELKNENDLEEVLRKLTLDSGSNEENNEEEYVTASEEPSEFPTIQEELAKYRRNEQRKYKNVMVAMMKSLRTEEALRAATISAKEFGGEIVREERGKTLCARPFYRSGRRARGEHSSHECKNPKT